MGPPGFDQPLADAQSIYRDTIDIDAGTLTFVVWAWAIGSTDIANAGGVRLRRHCDRRRLLWVKTRTPLEHPDLLGAPVGALLPWPVVAGSDVVALASIAILI